MKRKNKPTNLIMDMRPIKNTSRSYRVELKKIAKNRRILYIPVLLLAVAVLFWVLTSKTPSIEQRELAQVKSQVSKLMLLPKDEEPTLATVNDRKQLKDPFLTQKALDGDQILIYPNNQTVIIYRPSINKIVAVGNIFIDSALPEAQGASLTVLNGSNDNTKTQKIIEEVKKAYTDLKVVDGGSTNRHDFPNTIVIDNSKQKDNLVSALVAVISGKRGVVPLGENEAGTDLMIIVGKD